MTFSIENIPFAQRIVPEAGKESPVITGGILDAAATANPKIKTARMIAKKGVRNWDEIGKSPILSLEERILSATQTIDHFIDAKWLNTLVIQAKQNLGGRKKLDIVFPRAYEDGSLNLLPAAMAAKLQARLAEALPGIEVSINQTLFQASKANRTSASNAATLLARQQIFEGAVATDTAHLLLDEHLEAGATLKALDSYIRSQGGHVAAIATLSKNPGSQHLHILPETLEALAKALETNTKPIGKMTKAVRKAQSNGSWEQLEKMLAQLGLQPATLTNSEGLAVLAHISNDKAAFGTVLRAAGTTLDEYQNQGWGYIANLLDMPSEQKTLENLAKTIHTDLAKNYQYIGHTTQQAKA